MTDPAENGPVTFLNTFTPVEGGLEDLIEVQLAEMAAMAEEASALGWLGNRVYRSRDDGALLVITQFGSRAAQAAWAETDTFSRHVERLEPLLRSVTSTEVELLAAYGEG